MSVTMEQTCEGVTCRTGGHPANSPDVRAEVCDKTIDHCQSQENPDAKRQKSQQPPTESGVPQGQQEDDTDQAEQAEP